MRQINKMQILKIPNPLLNQISERINFPLSEQDRQNIESLKLTFRQSLKKKITLGISAPQIGIKSRFFIIPHNLNYTTYNQRIMSLLVRKFDVYINPQIKSFNNQKTTFNQSCLSVPQFQAQIQRPTKINIQYYNLSGQLIRQQIKGLRSRIIQHQIDHLDGITIDMKNIK